MATTPALSRGPMIEQIPVTKLSTLSYWDRLDDDQRVELTETVQELSAELVGQWKSVLRAGKLVDHLYEQTQPYGAFLRTLKALWGDYFSATTAYRYRNIYLATRETLNEKVIDVAVASGIALVTSDPEKPFGQYTDLIKKLPAPPNDLKGAKEWVDTFQRKKREFDEKGPVFERKATHEIATQMYVKARNLIRMLPKGKTRIQVVEEVFACLLHEVGGVSSMTIKAQAPPEEWSAIKRGRPVSKDKDK